MTKTGALIILAVALLTGCENNLLDVNDEVATTTIDKSFSSVDITGLEVSGINGAIELTGAQTDSVRITAKLRVEARTESAAEEGLEEIEVEFAFSGDGRLIISSLIPSNDDRNFQVSFTITAPQELQAEVETTNGALLIQGVTAPLEAHTTNGAILVRDASAGARIETTNGAIQAENVVGELLAETTNGAITALNAQPDSNDVELRTTNGAIVLTTVAALDAQVSARTTNGLISISGYAIDLSVNTPTRKEGSIGSGFARIELQTSNGNIAMTATP